MILWKSRLSFLKLTKFSKSSGALVILEMLDKNCRSVFGQIKKTKPPQHNSPCLTNCFKSTFQREVDLSKFKRITHFLRYPHYSCILPIHVNKLLTATQAIRGLQMSTTAEIIKKRFLQQTFLSFSDQSPLPLLILRRLFQLFAAFIMPISNSAVEK